MTMEARIYNLNRRHLYYAKNVAVGYINFIDVDNRVITHENELINGKWYVLNDGSYNAKTNEQWKIKFLKKNTLNEYTFEREDTVIVTVPKEFIKKGFINRGNISHEYDFIKSIVIEKKSTIKDGSKFIKRITFNNDGTIVSREVNL